MMNEMEVKGIKKVRCELNPLSDLVAKKVLTNPDIVAQFIHDVLGIQVDQVDILDVTDIRLTLPRAYCTSLDIFVECNHKFRVIIEIQSTKQRGFLKRLLYYLSSRVTEMLDQVKQSGVNTHEAYGFIKPVYVIALLKDGLFEQEIAQAEGWELISNQTLSEVTFGNQDHQLPFYRMGFINLAAFDSQSGIPWQQRRWMEYFLNQPFSQTLTGEDLVIEKADSYLKEAEWTREELHMIEKVQYIELEDFVRDYFLEGRQEGERIGQMRMAVQLMKSQGWSLEKVATALGLKAERIQAYINEQTV